MSLRLYMDHNVILAITAGCRSRGLDLLTALEDGMAQQPDEAILARATFLDRVVFTQDADFLRITGEWLSRGERFAGVIFGHQQRLSIGEAIENLVLIVDVLAPDEMQNQLIRLPL